MGRQLGQAEPIGNGLVSYDTKRDSTFRQEGQYLSATDKAASSKRAAIRTYQQAGGIYVLEGGTYQR